MLGRQAWNKGKKSPWSGKNGFKKGNKPWNKGIEWVAMKNENNPLWKGSLASMTAHHAWIVRRMGKPLKCSHCGLDDPKRMYHWSNISGEYHRDIEDYQRLCVPCHKKFDLNRV